jgi:hypothetical protein
MCGSVGGKKSANFSIFTLEAWGLILIKCSLKVSVYEYYTYSMKKEVVSGRWRILGTPPKQCMDLILPCIGRKVFMLVNLCSALPSRLGQGPGSNLELDRKFIQYSLEIN